MKCDTWAAGLNAAMARDMYVEELKTFAELAVSRLPRLTNITIGHT